MGRLSQERLLSEAEEKELFARYAQARFSQNVNEVVFLRDTILTRNLNLVHSVAWQHYPALSTPQKSKLEESDLFQAGVMGMMSAIDKYDLSRGVKFATFAMNHIRKEILKETARNRGTLTYSDHINDRVSKYCKTHVRLAGRLGRMPSDEEMAAEIGCSMFQLVQTKAAMDSMSLVDLNAMFNEADSRSIEYFPDLGPSPDEAVERNEDFGELYSALKLLTNEERQVAASFPT